MVISYSYNLLLFSISWCKSTQMQKPQRGISSYVPLISLVLQMQKPQRGISSYLPLISLVLQRGISSYLPLISLVLQMQKPQRGISSNLPLISLVLQMQKPQRGIFSFNMSGTSNEPKFTVSSPHKTVYEKDDCQTQPISYGNWEIYTKVA